MNNKKRRLRLNKIDNASAKLTWNNWFVSSNGMASFACTSASVWGERLESGTPKNSLSSDFCLNVSDGLCLKAEWISSISSCSVSSVSCVSLCFPAFLILSTSLALFNCSTFAARIIYPHYPPVSVYINSKKWLKFSKKYTPLLL